MGVQSRQTRDCTTKRTLLRKRFLVFPLLTSLILFGTAHCCWALQRHTLLPGADEGNQAVPSTSHARGEDRKASPARAAQTHGVGAGHSSGGTQSHQEPLQQQAPLLSAAVSQGHSSENQAQQPHANLPAATPPQDQLQGHSQATPTPVVPPSHGPARGEQGKGPSVSNALPEHEEEEEEEVEHGIQLPTISPVPGVTFVQTMIDLLDHELNRRFLGWRPNDLVLGRLTDNVNCYQLGVLEALRFTTLRLKDSLTRMGDADAYDPDLEQALNLLMNRATLFWFPSAETSYGEALDHLMKFLTKLETRQRFFYYRSDNLLKLMSSYKDLLGNVNRNLIRSNVSWFKSDDYFYYAKGVAHVYYEILRVVRVGFHSQLATTLDALDIMDEILHELHRAEQMDPWLILDSEPNSVFANHRANLNAPLSEVAHLLSVLSQL